jgi:hypothetical protein
LPVFTLVFKGDEAQRVGDAAAFSFDPCRDRFSGCPFVVCEHRTDTNGQYREDM